MKNRKIVIATLGALALVLALGVLIMADLRGGHTPVYYARVLTRSGSIVCDDLPNAGIQFSTEAFVPMQERNGSFHVQLKNTEDPRWKYCASSYSQLDYEQRIELYDNSTLMGNPVFCGVITEIPSDLGQQGVAGQSSLRRLETRKLRRYHQLTGNAASLAQDLLKTYAVVFQDDFNRATVGADWTTFAGSWAIVNNQLYGTPSSEIRTTSTSYNFDAARLSFDIVAQANSYSPSIRYRVDANNMILLTIQAPGSYNTDYLYDLEVFANGGVNQYWDRSLSGTAGAPLHVDFFTSLESGTRRIIVNVNGQEMFNVTNSALGTMTGSISILLGSYPGAVYFDNLVLASATPALTQGIFDSTSTTIDQTFNGDTHLAALRWIAELLGWGFRVNYKRGEGNDTLDFGENY